MSGWPSSRVLSTATGREEPIRPPLGNLIKSAAGSLHVWLWATVAIRKCATLGPLFFEDDCFWGGALSLSLGSQGWQSVSQSALSRERNRFKIRLSCISVTVMLPGSD